MRGYPTNWSDNSTTTFILNFEDIIIRRWIWIPTKKKRMISITLLTDLTTINNRTHRNNNQIKPQNNFVRPKSKTLHWSKWIAHKQQLGMQTQSNRNLTINVPIVMISMRLYYSMSQFWIQSNFDHTNRRYKDIFHWWIGQI